jgi:hypothetical protein
VDEDTTDGVFGMSSPVTGAASIRQPFQKPTLAEDGTVDVFHNKPHYSSDAREAVVRPQGADSDAPTVGVFRMHKEKPADVSERRAVDNKVPEGKTDPGKRIRKNTGKYSGLDRPKEGLASVLHYALLFSTDTGMLYYLSNCDARLTAAERSELATLLTGSKETLRARVRGRLGE